MELANIAKTVQESTMPVRVASQNLDQFKQARIDLIDAVIELLKSCERDTSKLLDWLATTSFWEDPASYRYHNAFYGGLLDHSFNVYQILKNKVELFGLKIPKDSIILTALLHDVCKIGTYNIKESWRKDDNNRWESYAGYGFNEDEFPMGHGEKSVIMLNKYIELSEVEQMAIRWHGGLSEDPKGYTFSRAAIISDLVTLLHTSDFEASMILEPQGTIEWLVDIK